MMELMLQEELAVISKVVEEEMMIIMVHHILLKNHNRIHMEEVVVEILAISFQYMEEEQWHTTRKKP